jgi:hypothetical protein
MFCSLLECYIDKINSTGVPNLESAWEAIINKECELGLRDAIAAYDANCN